MTLTPIGPRSNPFSTESFAPAFGASRKPQVTFQALAQKPDTVYFGKAPLARRGLRAFVLTAVASLTLACGSSAAPAQPGSTTTTTAVATAQCNDGRDNDRDRKIDLLDSGCTSLTDRSEKPECNDGLDNDGDGKKDMRDSNCTSRTDNTERPKKQCNDGRDNDADGKIDGNDPGCRNRSDNSENSDVPPPPPPPATQCADGADNDGDGRIDAGDPGCANPDDNNEADDPPPPPPPAAQCADGLDNDGDAKIDANDPGCANPDDNNEADDPPPPPPPAAQCADGLDNDGDAKIDANDPGCANADDDNEADDPPPPPPGDISNQVLSLDPRKPGNINIFTSIFPINGAQGFYPEGSAMEPASGPIATEAAARDQLTAYVNEQFGNDPAQTAEALAIYDDATVKTRIPDPALRAAFAGMNGTFLEPAIDHFLNSGHFGNVRYAALANSSLIAFTSGPATGRSITFNRRYQSEDFRYLIGVMGHEILHDDTTTPTSEEAILNTLSAMSYLQTLVKNPELAYTGTELSRQMNDLAMMFLNSRENDSPDSEIVAPTGTGIIPGSPRNAPDAWSLFNGSGTAPAPGILSPILSGLGASGADFSQATAESFSGLNDNWLSDKERVQISVLLQLVTPAEIAQATGLSEQEAIDNLGLQPYLDAIR